MNGLSCKEAWKVLAHEKKYQNPHKDSLNDSVGGDDNDDDEDEDPSEI